MPFFSEGVTKIKLTILYFLNKLGFGITKDQITTVGGTYDLAPYFDLQSAVAEMEEDGFLAAVPRPFGQIYALTARGQQAVELFYEQLPTSLRDDLDTYADECRETLRHQCQYTARIEGQPNGSYIVRMIFMERDEQLLAMELLFPDVKSANRAAALWADKAQSAYCYLLSSLSVALD